MKTALLPPRVYQRDRERALPLGFNDPAPTRISHVSPFLRDPLSFSSIVEKRNNKQRQANNNGINPLIPPLPPTRIAIHYNYLVNA
jgi:hypothetical protein